MPLRRRWRPATWLSRLLLGVAAPAAAQTGVGEFNPAVPAAPIDPNGLFNEAFFLKVGFSFMVGLAVGYALKVAFKVALVIFGLILLGIFALQYAGIAQVDWSGMEVRYDTWATWLSVNGGAFLDFVGNNLSSTASFIAGLALGLKI
ncbi:MAG: FUN14 domain-containing protein [Lamprocystis purpurea]|nr:FUN14 domain-containing protein [Lamprocystis purpurea]